MNNLLTDGKGNKYINAQNVRITLVDKTNNPDKDWANIQKYIRIQAKTGEGNKLHRGAELPFRDDSDLLDFISAFIQISTSKP